MINIDTINTNQYKGDEIDNLRSKQCFPTIELSRLLGPVVEIFLV